MPKEKANGHHADKVALILPPNKRLFYEQACNTHRIMVAESATTADLENVNFLSAVNDKIAAGDLAYIFSEHYRHFWMAVAIGAPREAGAHGGGTVRLVVLSSADLPSVDGNSGRDLPAGYSMFWNPETRRHVPMWGETPLNGDGFSTSEEARKLILHHNQQAASVARR